jgi:hypothetical protein
MNGDPMAIAASPPVPDVSRRVLRLQFAIRIENDETIS